MTSAKASARQRITDYLLDEVLPTLQVGAELPTIAELCGQFGVTGVQTVRNGVQPLVDAGFVETRYAPTRRWVVRKVPPLGVGDDPVDLDRLSAQLTEARAALTAALATLDHLRRPG